jgi:tetratricopeptide (TPR) repeat protein
MLAEVHITLHDFEKAKMHGAKSFSINPNDPRVLSVYGEALLRTGQIDSGIEYLEKAYELDPVPQGQSTSDRRISALLLARFIEAKTKESSLEECSRLKDKLVEHDKRSWLISIAILERQGQDYAAESWYSDNYAEFSKSDWPLEIDRFHLNDKSMEDSLLQLADNLPEPEN